MAPAVVVSALIAGLLAGVATAQSTNATCQATYSWMKNAQGQDPCLLASYLSMPCAGSQGAWVSQPVGPQNYYLSPSNTTANPCLCSAVFYSVVSACAYCQGGVVSTWYQWIPDCAAYESATYPVAVVAGTSIPGWATLPIPASGTWDATAAYNYALSPSASITLGGSSTAGTSVSATSASGSSTSTTTSQSPTSTSSASNGAVVGAAVGGTIGGLGLLAGIGFLIWFFCIRQNSGNGRTSGELDDDGKLPSPPVQVQPWNGMLTNNGYNYASLPQHSPDAPIVGNVPYHSSTPGPMSPTSGISYATPQQAYAPQPSPYSGPGSDINSPTVRSESNSGYGAPSNVVYGIANPGPQQQYANQYSSAPYNSNQGFNNPASISQGANPNLLEGFDGGMHAPPPSYEAPAPGPSAIGAGTAGAPRWSNEKR